MFARCGHGRPASAHKPFTSTSARGVDIGIAIDTASRVWAKGIPRKVLWEVVRAIVHASQGRRNSRHLIFAGIAGSILIFDADSSIINKEFGFEYFDPSLSPGNCRACCHGAGDPKSKVSMKRRVATCPLAAAPATHMEKRGFAWMIGGFAICPCHLPLTLGLIGSLFSGTAVGALINRHQYIAGGVITFAWVAATWRGVSYVRSSRRTN